MTSLPIPAQPEAGTGPLSIAEASRGLVVFRVLVHPRDVVFLKGVLEASDGVANIFAESGGDLAVAAPAERVAELRRILADLTDEIGARVVEPALDTPVLDTPALVTPVLDTPALVTPALVSSGGLA